MSLEIRAALGGGLAQEPGGSQADLACNLAAVERTVHGFQRDAGVDQPVFHAEPAPGDSEALSGAPDRQLRAAVSLPGAEGQPAAGRRRELIEIPHGWRSVFRPHVEYAPIAAGGSGSQVRIELGHPGRDGVDDRVTHQLGPNSDAQQLQQGFAFFEGRRQLTRRGGRRGNRYLSLRGLSGLVGQSQGTTGGSPSHLSNQHGARRRARQSSGVKIQALVAPSQPRLRILGQSEALPDGVVGGEIGASSQPDRLVELQAVEHRDLVGAQSRALPGDEKAVQHRRRAFAAYLDRQLGEVGDQELDIGVAVSKDMDDMERLSRSAGPRMLDHGVLQQQVQHAVGQGVEPEVRLVEQLGGERICPGQFSHTAVSAVLFSPVEVSVE